MGLTTVQALEEELITYSSKYIIKLKRRGLSEEKISAAVKGWLEETLYFYKTQSFNTENQAIEDFRKRSNPRYYEKYKK